MDIYVYSDESGVFDRVHNDIYVFGGVIFLSKSEKDKCCRKYLHAEKVIRESRNIPFNMEIKATSVKNSDKGKLYRSLNDVHKFAVIVYQKNLNENIFNEKKSKQRFLDYAYKIGVKRNLEKLIRDGIISPNDVKRLYFNVDEHTTATNGCYELREGLEQEFKSGTYNATYDIFYPPIFKGLHNVYLNYCNSSSNPLVRAADIVANKIYYAANNHILSRNNADASRILSNQFVSFLP